MGIADVLGGDNTDPFSLAIIAVQASGSLLNAGGDALSAGGLGGALIALEDLAIDMRQPCIGIIPIKCDKYSVSRRIEVSDTMVIKAGGEGGNDKNFVTDNSAPHPREWRIHGYCASLIPFLETGIILKPTLLIQKTYLDEKAASRKAVTFKTTDGEMVKVLIQNLEIIDDPKDTTHFEISVSVKEFVPAVALVGSSKDLLGAGASPSLASTILGSLNATVTAASIALAAAPAAISNVSRVINKLQTGEAGRQIEQLFNPSKPSFSTGLERTAVPAVLNNTTSQRSVSSATRTIVTNSIILPVNYTIVVNNSISATAQIRPANAEDKLLSWDIVGQDKQTVVPYNIYFSIAYLSDKNKNTISVLAKDTPMEADTETLYIRATLASSLAEGKTPIRALSRIKTISKARIVIPIRELLLSSNSIKGERYMNKSIDYLITPSNADMVQVAFGLYRPITLTFTAGELTAIADYDVSTILNPTIISSLQGRIYGTMAAAVAAGTTAADTGNLTYNCLVINATDTDLDFTDSLSGVASGNTSYYGAFSLDSTETYNNPVTFNKIRNNVFDKIGREVGNSFWIKPLASNVNTGTLAVLPYVLVMKAWDVNAVIGQGSPGSFIPDNAVPKLSMQKVFVYNSTIPLQALSLGDGSISLAIN